MTPVVDVSTSLAAGRPLREALCSRGYGLGGNLPRTVFLRFSVLALGMFAFECTYGCQCSVQLS